MDEKIITTNELEVLANEFYGSKITQEEYFSRLDDIDCYQAHYLYLQPIITQYFIDNKSEIWLLFLIAHSKR